MDRDGEIGNSVAMKDAMPAVTDTIEMFFEAMLKDKRDYRRCRFVIPLRRELDPFPWTPSERWTRWHAWDHATPAAEYGRGQ